MTAKRSATSSANGLAHELRTAWLHAMASDQELDRIRETLQRQPESLRHLQQEQRLHHALGHALAPGPQASVAQRLRSSVMAEIAPSCKRTFISLRYSAIAAIAAALLLGIWWWGPPAPEPELSAPSQAFLASGSIEDATGVVKEGTHLPQGVALQVQERAQIRWAGVNRVELFGPSQLSWQGEDSPRLHLRQGSAQAAIGKGPFALYLPDMQAEVLGTNFAAHHGWWGSFVSVQQGKVAVSADERQARLGAGEARWLFSSEARARQEQLLAGVDSTWRPEQMQLLHDRSAVQQRAWWEGPMASTDADGVIQLQGNGRFLPDIPGQPTFLRVHLRIDRLDGRAGLALQGQHQLLAGDAVQQNIVGDPWEMELYAWQVAAWPGGLGTWFVEGHINQQALRLRIDSHDFRAGVMLEGDALIETLTIEGSDAWPVWQAPHPQR